MADLPAAGFLPVDKPAGPTSHDVVARARRALGLRRIGHTGTLDPFASGLLLLAMGRATRLAEYLSGLPKAYSAVMRLGQTTDTDDPTGEILTESGDWKGLDRADIDGALQKQVGLIRQLPPAYSAKKVAGQRLYRAAREGREVERRPAEVTVHSIELTGIDGRDVAFDVVCGSGTYIRAIARDAGEALGVGAHLTALRRTAIGPHRVENAVPLERLDNADLVGNAWLSPAEALSHMPSIAVGVEEAAALGQGRPIPVDPATPVGVTAALEGEELIAVGEVRQGSLQPRKVFTG